MQRILISSEHPPKIKDEDKPEMNVTMDVLTHIMDSND